jgi:UDP-N-acetylglucosamine acyltransferase
MSISSLAYIHPKAIIGKNVSIGPFCYIDEDVEIGDDCTLDNSVTIKRYSIIGKNNYFHSGSVIGGTPQDLKFHGEKTILTIGDNNTFRECVTINRGTEAGIGETTIGNNNLLQCYVHIAHDCVIENNIVISAYAGLAGHVHVENFAILGAQSGYHQFVTIGQHAFIHGTSGVTMDVPPYMLCAGSPGKVRGLNLVGLRRKNIPRESILALKVAHRLIYRSDLNIKQAIEGLENSEEYEVAEVRELVKALLNSDKGQGRYRESIRSSSEKGPNNITSFNSLSTKEKVES